MFKRLKSLIFTVEEEETPVEAVKEENTEDTIVLPNLMTLEEKVEEKAVTFTISDSIKPKTKEIKHSQNYDFETIISPIYGSSVKTTAKKETKSISISTRKLNRNENGIISPMYGTSSNDIEKTEMIVEEEVTLDELIANNSENNEELVQFTLFNEKKEGE